MDNIRDNLYLYDCCLRIKDLWDYPANSDIGETANKLLHSIVKDDFHKKNYGDDDIVKKLVRHPEKIIYSWCYYSDCHSLINTGSTYDKADDFEYDIEYIDTYIDLIIVSLGICEFDKDFYDGNFKKEYLVGLYEQERFKLTETLYDEKLKNKINLSYEEFIDYISENF